MIEVEFNNIRYVGFTGISITRDIENLCAEFSISSSPLSGGGYPMQRGQACKIYIDNEQVLNGYIDKIDIAYETGNHIITIAGRDRTSDIIDSTVDSTVEIKTPVSLENIIRQVLVYLNATDIKIINRAGALQPLTVADVVSGQIGQSAVEFLHGFCAKRQVLLTSDEDGNLVLTRGEGKLASTALIHRINGLTNNVKSAKISYSDEKRFNRYIVRAQPIITGLDDLESDTPLPTTSGIKGESIDSTVRKSRILTLNADKITDVNESINRAQWERDIRRARAINYTAVVYGHRQGEGLGALWRPLQIVNVVDDHAGIDDELIIRRVTWVSELAPTGDVTTLDLVPKDTYQLLASEGNKKKKSKKPGFTQKDVDEIISYGKT